MSEPTWERIRSADRRPLTVRPIRRASVDVLRIVAGDVPEHGGATVFDAWTDGHGETAAIVVRAAAVRDQDVTPLEIRARTLEVVDSDGRLEALLAGGGAVAARGELERQACACRGVSIDAAYRAIGAGWETVDAVKRATRIGFGPCQGRRCVPWLAGTLELDPADPRGQITPRPPIVPVPISVLAAFAGDDGGDDADGPASG